MKLEIIDRPLTSPFVLNFEVEEGFNSTALRHFELRFLAVDGTGSVIAASPSQSVAFSTNRQSLIDVATNHGFPISDITSVPWQMNRFALLGPGGPGTIPLGCVPCFYDDDIPAPRGDM